jgi:photoactive yellow protein
MDAIDHLPSFNTPRLAAAVDALPSHDVDLLPFGAIKLDIHGVVRFYNSTEAKLSGRGVMPTLGKLFFIDVAPCLDNAYFKGRIEKAMIAGTLDLSFSSIGDFADRDRELSVRVQSAQDGGVWIFHQRPAETSL